MVLKLYGNLASPPVRAVHMTIKHLNIPVEIVKLDLAKGELKGEEYMKINPQGTMPCFEDDGFLLLDSHAINIYLATKYPQGEKLYPSDPKKRAIVNERLFFESGELFGALKVQFLKLYRNALKEIDEEVVLSFEKGYGGLETYLKNGKFVAGDSLTIADFSVIASLNHMKLLVPADKEKFPLVNAYIERATSWPFYEEIIEAGFNEYLEVLKARNMQLPTKK